MTIRLLQGDCRAVLPTLEAESVDSIVTDPPAGIGFMGKGWDSDKGGRDHWIAWMQAVAAECLRVLKPGGHALVWAIPRTSHWTAMAWENAGWEVRDRVSHLFGSGFPKSLDVSKAIDKAAGAEREVVGPSARHVSGKPGQRTSGLNGSSTFAESVGMGSVITAPATAAARQWQGWGTALKPACEDFWLFQKPVLSAGYCAIIKQTLGILENGLCKPSANPAARASALFQADSSEAKTDSVLGSAPTRQEEKAERTMLIGEAGDTLQTGMSSSVSAAETCLSIVTLWKGLLEEASERLSTFTTAMESSLTTDLKTLSYWISQITPDCMLQAASHQSGPRLLVANVGSLFSGLSEKARSIQTLSALSSATPKAGSPSHWAGKLHLDEFGQSKELSPNCEDWWLLRKSLQGTVAANVLAHSTGGLNIDGCRIESGGVTGSSDSAGLGAGYAAHNKPDRKYGNGLGGIVAEAHALGRWPANIVTDGSDEVIAAFPQSAASVLARAGAAPGKRPGGFGNIGAEKGSSVPNGPLYSDTGSAARFFFSAKASRADRNEGLQQCTCYNQAWAKEGRKVVTRAATGTPPKRDTTESTSAGDPEWLTSSHGNDTTAALFPEDSKFITETRTSRTTSPETSNLSIPSRTSDCTPAVNFEPEFGGSRATSATSGNLSESSTGISAGKDGPSTGAAGPAISESSSRRSGNDGRCANCGALTRSTHPTVKPTALMRWLCRLVTPPGGTVLDPFCGSGSTLKAAELEGFDGIGIELSDEYLEIARRRIAADAPLFAEFAA